MKAEIIKPKKLFGGGWQRPITDEDGNKWCNCIIPKLTHNRIPREAGTAYCIRCGEHWYH